MVSVPVIVVAAMSCLAAPAVASDSRFLGPRRNSQQKEEPKDVPPVYDAFAQFDEFKVAFGRSYSSEAEEEVRFRAFSATLRSVDVLNNLNGAPIFGINHLADREDHEAAAMTSKGLDISDIELLSTLGVASVGGNASADTSGGLPLVGAERLPPKIDWRRTKAVTPVKAQGGCGDCWAFSVAETVESHYVLHVDEWSPELFSVQQITSCADRSNGCGGGNPIAGFLYLKNALGLAQEVFWPFAGALTWKDSCDFKNCTESCDARKISMITKNEMLMGPYAVVENAYFAIPPCRDDSCLGQDLYGLSRVLNTVGPVSVSVNAKNWKFYRGGVLTFDACGNVTRSDMDHAVQLVGYNMQAEVPYWIVRNSWSTLWGDRGYIYLEYGKNTCGIANLVTYPKVAAGAGLAMGHSRRLGQDSSERFQRLHREATAEEVV